MEKVISKQLDTLINHKNLPAGFTEMPLLISPIDGSPMKQIHRFGIEIDVCPTSGGIWLDKGELEKLMAILKEESAHDQAYSAGHREDDRHARSRDRGYDDDDDRYGRSSHDHDRKKHGKMSRIMDIFDF